MTSNFKPFDGPRKETRDETLGKDEALLSSLGYKQELKREFKPLEVRYLLSTSCRRRNEKNSFSGVAYSVIGLLPSLASVMINSLPNGGGPAMVWGWLVAGVFVTFISLAVAELGSAAPTSGGLYFWTFALSPPRWRNLLCWLVGYANTTGNIAGLASVGWGCASQIMAAATIGSNGTFHPSSAQIYGVYVAIIVSQAVICSLGTAVMARLQILYVTLNILLVVVVIIALPVATPVEFKNTSQFALRDFYNSNGWPNGFAFILSFLSPLWTICGFDGSVHISEEASNAAIAVPWAIMGATILSVIFGFGANMALAFCMGTNYDLLLGSQQPMATIFFNSFGQKPTLALWAFVVIVLYMTGSSILLAGSRQVFAFGRDHALPLSWWLYRVNTFTNTPLNTVWFTSGLAVLLGLLAFAGPQAIGAVLTLGVVALYFAYCIPIGARIIWGRRALRPGPFDLGTLSVPISLIAVVFMTFMIIVFLFPTASHPTSQGMNYSVVVFGGVMSLSICWYYFPKYGGVYWFTGPVKNVDIPVQGLEEQFLDHDDTEKAEAENIVQST
ncbi:APC amino acid permease [Crepidotus variabilis]|uniref:APC amino acid permease n=1 Tax=Crepidotus variabilis TaxID=179855 RepID=A0A9P6EGC3_9AGAR|nr:APC amino acid permease [Crepidotus variabilis]